MFWRVNYKKMMILIIFLLLFTSFSFAETGLKTFDNYKDAIEEYSKAVEINPKDAAASINRGVAYDKLGNYNRVHEKIWFT